MAEKIVGIIPHKTNDIDLNNLATKIFTVGGIDITTNLEPTRTFDRISPSYTSVFTLDDLPIPTRLIRTIESDGNVSLSYNPSNPKYFAKYGSLLELMRVSLEGIILKYPAAIHSKMDVLGIIGNNVLNAGYLPINNTTTFAANVSFFSNPFSIYFLDNLQFEYEDNRINQNRNLTLNFLKYEIIVDGVGYPILDFIPASKESNDVVNLVVQGQPFDLGNNSVEFYIKPISNEIKKFYVEIEEFEAYLLNPTTEMSSIFETVRKVDGGVTIDYKIKYQFPKLDEYNLDVNSPDYDVYVEDLIDFATEYDETHANLLMRILTPENIQSVTLESESAVFPAYGKINKVLIIYGRELDKINRYIENIKFFNNVTYDKKDNIPAALINNFATNLGWDVIQPDNIDADFWRFIILNSAWVWKSKGTRRAIEFILKFTGIPMDIVDFNEYIIRAKKPVDIILLEKYYALFSDNFDFSTLPIDSEGYPVFPSQTDIDYFQMNGISDSGMAYFYRWFNLLPEGFTGSSVNYSGSTTTLETLFEQDFNESGSTLGYTIVDDSLDTNECYDSTGDTIDDPYPAPVLDICGCPLPISDRTLEICAEPVSLEKCNPIILDVWYDCTSASGATLYINSYGGYEPVTISGATDGQFIGSGETVQIIATDVSGCTSDIVSITIDCVDPCLNNFIVVDLDYNCILDAWSQNTGQAIISLSASGGVAPYTYNGVQDGDTANHGEIITVEVIDAEGCSSGLIGLTVNCATEASVPCDSLNLNSTLETVNVETQNLMSKVNVTYDLTGLPSGLFIDNVTLTSAGNGGDSAYVVGNPQTTVFTSVNGADTIQLDFATFGAMPTEINMAIDIIVVLSNGCTYTDNWDLIVDPRKLGNAAFYNAII